MSASMCSKTMQNENLHSLESWNLSRWRTSVIVRENHHTTRSVWVYILINSNHPTDKATWSHMTAYMSQYEWRFAKTKTIFYIGMCKFSNEKEKTEIQKKNGLDFSIEFRMQSDDSIFIMHSHRPFCTIIAYIMCKSNWLFCLERNKTEINTEQQYWNHLNLHNWNMKYFIHYNLLFGHLYYFDFAFFCHSFSGHMLR